MDIEITKMTSKGQVVIPQDIRNHKGIREGEKFLVYELDDSIVLKRIKGMEKAKSVDDFERIFSSMWKTAKKKGVTAKDIEQEISAYRKQDE